MEISNLTTAFLEYKLCLYSPNSLSVRGFFYGEKGANLSYIYRRIKAESYRK